MKRQQRQVYNRNLQEKLDIFTMSMLATYYEQNKQQSVIMNTDPSYNYVNHWKEEQKDEIEKKGYPFQKKIVLDSVGWQLNEMFKYLEENGAQSPYPPNSEFRNREPDDLGIDISTVDPKVKEELRKQWNEYVYTPGTPIRHPGGFRLQIRKSKIDHPESGYGMKCHVSECTKQSIKRCLCGWQHTSWNCSGHLSWHCLLSILFDRSHCKGQRLFDITL